MTKKGLLKGILIYGGITLILVTCIFILPQILPLQGKDPFGLALFFIIFLAVTIQYDFEIKGNVSKFDLSKKRKYWQDESRAILGSKWTKPWLFLSIAIFFILVIGGAVSYYYTPIQNISFSIVVAVISPFYLLLVYFLYSSTKISKEFSIYESGLRFHNYFLPWGDIEVIYTRRAVTERSVSRFLLPFVILIPRLWGAAITTSVAARITLLRVKDKKGKLYLIPNEDIEGFKLSMERIGKGNLIKS